MQGVHSRSEGRMRVGRFFSSVAVLTAGCLVSQSAQAQTAMASLKDASGKDVGQVQLRQTVHGVLLKLTVKGLPAAGQAFPVPPRTQPPPTHPPPSPPFTSP